MARQQSQQELDAVISLKELCAEIERATTLFERDMDGIYRDMSAQVSSVEIQVARTQKEFSLFETGILQEMNHLVAGFLPQKAGK